MVLSEQKSTEQDGRHETDMLSPEQSSVGGSAVATVELVGEGEGEGGEGEGLGASAMKKCTKLYNSSLSRANR